MLRQRSSKVVVLLLIALLIFFLDAGSKYYTSHFLPQLDSRHLWFPYGWIAVFQNLWGVDFSIVHATNRGIAWGLLSQYQLLLLCGRIVLIGGLIVYAFFINRNRRWDLPLALIITGASANVLDYFLYGHVIDMFYFIFWGYHYPIFNVADSAICIGSFWLVLVSKLGLRENVA